jgi:hypothetical protein
MIAIGAPDIFTVEAIARRVFSDKVRRIGCGELPACHKAFDLF